jgi:hypothetical protein
MDLLSSLKLPHGLIIAGVVLVAMGFLGLVLARKKRAATNLVLEPRTQLPQMPQPPGSLEPSRRRDGEITDDLARPRAD